MAESQRCQMFSTIVNEYNKYAANSIFERLLIICQKIHSTNGFEKPILYSLHIYSHPRGVGGGGGLRASSVDHCMFNQLTNLTMSR